VRRGAVSYGRMRDATFESLAFARRFLVALASFVLAFVALAAVAVYLIVTYLRTEAGWLNTIVFLLQLLPFLFAGAGGVAWLTTYLVELPHYWRGDYHCHWCGRSYRNCKEICLCQPQARVAKRPPRHWVHYRRRIKPVLLTYLLILSVVVINMALQTGPRHYPFVLDLMIGHAVLTALLGVLLHLVSSILEFLGRGRRFRLRETVFVRLLAIWPFCFCVVMAVLTALGVT
jgi:hypothetical protein